MRTGNIDWNAVTSNKWLLAWLVLGTATVLIPPMHWGINRRSYYNSYGQYVEYEEQQRQAEEAYNQQQEQQNNNNNDDGNSYYSSKYRSCGKWDFGCNKQQEKYAQMYFSDNGSQDNNNNQYNNYNGYRYDDNGNPMAPEQTVPVWFQLISGGASGEMSEARKKWEEENTGQRVEDDREREEEQGKSTLGEALVAVYMVGALVATVVYGAFRLKALPVHCSGADHKERARNLLQPVVGAIFVLANLLLINLFLVPKLVSTDNRMLEGGETVFGWEGQVGVLMAYIDLFGLLFCAVFGAAFYFAFYRRSKDENNNAKDAEDEGYTLA